MKLIDISTPKYPNAVAMVSDEDYNRLSQWKWHRCDQGYAKRTVWQKGKYLRFLMHRVALECPPGFIVDHINGNRLDNRRENLRICTVTDNNHNRRAEHGTSKYKGVCWYRRDKCFRAKIRVGSNNRKHLGNFKDEVEAARAYDRAAIQFHGEFAVLNFPMSEYTMPQMEEQ